MNECKFIGFSFFTDFYGSKYMLIGFDYFLFWNNDSAIYIYSPLNIY